MDHLPQPANEYYAIEGINCHACAFVIKDALAEAGFDNIAVDLEKKELIVPRELVVQITKIKQAVDNAGHYKLVINN